MNVHHGIEGLKKLPAGSVLTIGNFDGVHLGHRKILQQMYALRSATRGARLAVATFEPHPLTVLRPQLAPPRLTTPARKQHLLEEAGVEELVILPPTRDVLGLTAEQFWAILRDEVRPRHLVEGSSFNFGKDRAGTIPRLREWCQTSDVQLHVIDAVTVPLLDLQVVEVSSSLTRWLISYGRVREAAICLGRAYELHGAVVRGHGRGRQIGIPTANIDCQDQLLPADGVYAARCTVDRRTYPVALSIGTMPTFGQNQRQIEAHLIGFDGNLYDRVLEVQLLDWLREQVRFDGIDRLKQQLFRDLEQASRCRDTDPARVIAALSVA